MPVEDQAMDKKAISKSSQVPGNNSQDPKLKPNPDYNGGNRGGRGRRGATLGGAQARRLPPQRQERRPRERAPAPQTQQCGNRGQVVGSAEAGSVFKGGSKKGYHDASHLVNFRCESARDRHAERYSSSQWQLQRAAHWHERPHWHPPSRVFRPRHVKEQYLQAKCQFVVRDDGAYADNLSDPDRLVDWACVEQVWLHEEDAEPTTCPICLYPPVAARITRCGHTYCVACLLHYLALSDQTSRRCPICEQTVHPDQVRRCRLLPRVPVHPGDSVTFRLMRRRPESLLGQPADADQSWEELITLSDSEEKQRLTKLVLASPQQVSSLILAPERAVLERQLAELGSEPEACFVQQALAQLEEDERAAGERADAADGKPRRPDPAAAASQTTPLPAAAEGDAVVYESAFDERTVGEDVVQGERELTSPEEESGGGARARTVSEASGSDVTAADLEVAETPQPSAGAGPQPQQGDPLYYYQAEDGAPVFLHALNCRVLLEEYGGWEQCPARLTAALVDVDVVTMTAGFRQRLRSLRHLPLTSQLLVCEARLGPPEVSEQTLVLFKDQIRKREQRRRDKQRRDRQRERRLRQEEREQRRRADATYDQAFPVDRPRRTPSPEPLPPVAAEAPTEQDQPAASSGPSFAALLRGGGRRVWPAAPRPVSAAPAVVKMPASDVREDGDPTPPSFSDSWSAGLAAALEQLDRGHAGDAEAETGTVAKAKPKGRKGKKGKIVLVSGGLSF